MYDGGSSSSTFSAIREKNLFFMRYHCCHHPHLNPQVRTYLVPTISRMDSQTTFTRCHHINRDS